MLASGFLMRNFLRYLNKSQNREGHRSKKRIPESQTPCDSITNSCLISIYGETPSLGQDDGMMITARSC